MRILIIEDDQQLCETLKLQLEHAGYQTDCVYYDRKERVAGESKYPLKAY